MNFKIRPIVSALLLAVLNPIAAQAVTAPVIADAHIAAVNAGTAPAVAIDPANTGLMKFDLFALPENVASADIGKATLVLFVKNVKTAGKLQLSFVDQPWTENTVNAALAPQTDSPATETAEILLGNNYVTADVSEFVRRWLDNPESNNGLQLAPLESTATALTLDSKEAVQTSHAAYIEIVLNGPAGEKGVKGDKGDKGDTGAQGPQGFQGPIGPQGNPGPQGAQGQAGVSGYQIVQVNGTVPSAFSPISLRATCPSPKKVIGGGCRVNDFITQAVSGFPNSTSFLCSYKTGGINEGVQAFAICAFVN